ncbi:acylphosphatase [Salinibacterium sp. dk2585]|uniref:acylphosphatase n=1 Tax=unclassified Salinibacterium TaxID=2632331 RepID=UPI0011C24F87|nr:MULTISPECIES: acylphosphatase [unclassified Salinibacterium]QEE62067.1 acylphosphatase [Salinibacterium sp. dk2585]TXK53419.1 acylphosphatase [Salinibacterium sp. dk5596]
MHATPSDDTTHRRIRATVHGAVQGVGFRWATAEHATEIGASGWVRNQTDGTVLAEIEGSLEQVDDMIDFLHRGSQFARVDNIDIEELTPDGSAGFTIH